MASEQLPTPDDVDFRARPTELLLKQYKQMRQFAQAIISEMRRHSVGATDLVHSAFIKLDRIDKDMTERELYALARVIFKNSLISRCRSSRAQLVIPSFDLSHLPSDATAVAAIDESLGLLERLQEQYPEAAEVFELEVFYDQTREQIALQLAKTPAQIRRLSLHAKSVLRRWVEGNTP